MENGCEFDAIDASQSHQTRKHPCKRMRVVGMSIFEFDREKYDDMVREEGREEGAFKTLYELVKDNLLSLANAAKKVGQNEEEFASGMEAYFAQQQNYEYL